MVEVGQLVLVGARVDQWANPVGTVLNWMDDMDAAVGRVGRVTHAGDYGLKVRVPGLRLERWYPPETLTPVSQGPVTEAEFLSMEW